MLARGGQPLGELEHAVVLLAVAGLVPGLVVEVLPTGIVGANGLDVPVAVGADPDVLPRGRDDERLGPLAVLGVMAEPSAPT